MEANEAPEKIYMTPSFGEPDNVLLASFSKSHLNYHRDIEYTRTDAFIDKTIGWIDYNNRNGGCNFDGWEKDFKNYMKRE